MKRWLLPACAVVGLGCQAIGWPAGDGSAESAYSEACRQSVAAMQQVQGEAGQIPDYFLEEHSPQKRGGEFDPNRYSGHIS